MKTFWDGFEKQAVHIPTVLKHTAGGAALGATVGAATSEKGKRTKDALRGAATGGALGGLLGHAKIQKGFNRTLADVHGQKWPPRGDMLREALSK